MNRSGPRHDPCGTPCASGKVSDSPPLTETRCVRSERYGFSLKSTPKDMAIKFLGQMKQIYRKYDEIRREESDLAQLSI